MPPPKKLDLIPEEFRRWLSEELQSRGFADIVDVTDALNARLATEGVAVSVGKTAVGEYSKLLKDQREAFTVAEQLLGEMDVEQEGELHKVLMQMIATSAVQMIRAVREGDGHLEPKDLMSLGRMLKDLMASSGMREKLLADERDRVAQIARQEMQAELEDRLDQGVARGGFNADAARAAREIMGFA